MLYHRFHEKFLLLVRALNLELGRSVLLPRGAKPDTSILAAVLDCVSDEVRRFVNLDHSLSRVYFLCFLFIEADTLDVDFTSSIDLGPDSPLFRLNLTLHFTLDY